MPPAHAVCVPTSGGGAVHETQVVVQWAQALTRVAATVTAVGFEPTPFRTGALSQRLRPLGQTVSAYSCAAAAVGLGCSGVVLLCSVGGGLRL